MQYKLNALEQGRDPNVARLNAVLNRPAEAPLPWPRQEPIQPVEIDRRTLVAVMKENNPQLQAMGFDVEQLRREVDVAKRNFYPDIGLEAQWMKMNMGEMSGNDDDLMLGLQLNLPIWRRSYKAGELQARAMARRAQHEKKDMENELVARTARTLYEYEDNGRRLRLYGDELGPRAQQLISVSEAAYLAGTVDFLSLIDAQQMLLEFRLERERASASRQQKLAELEMLAGTGLAGPMPESKSNEQGPAEMNPATSDQRN